MRHWARWGGAKGYTMHGRIAFFIDKGHYTTRQRHAIFLDFGRQLLRDGYKEGTVDGYISDVQAAHREVLEEEVVGEQRGWQRWRRRLRAAAKRAPNRARAAPKELLRAAVRRARRGKLDGGIAAAMVVAFFGALRRCEYTAVSGRKARKLQLRWRRVVFWTKDFKKCKATSRRCVGVSVKVYRKSDGGAFGQWIAFWPTGDAHVCPVRELRKLARESGAPPNRAVFTHEAGRYVSGDAVNAAIKQCAGDFGISREHMSTHSLRRGGSVAMQAAGLSDELRMEYCAWRSETHRLYKSPLPGKCKGITARMWGAVVQAVGNGAEDLEVGGAGARRTQEVRGT